MWKWDEYVTREELIQIAISVSILILFFLFRKLFTKILSTIIMKLTKKVPNSFFSSILLAFEKPIQWLFIVIGVYLSLSYFPYIDHKTPLLTDLFRVSLIILVSWGLYNLSGATSVLFTSVGQRLNFQIDDLLIPFLSKALRFTVVVISISVIAQEFDYNVNGFVAGLGLGGLAFALAAKDALANLFGGIVIISEKPFTKGDWILTPSVEGTVEDITFRSTRVRTFAQAVVTVPNATLANEPITNWSKMGKRQVSSAFRISPKTPQKTVERCLEQIRRVLHQHEGVHPETILAYFTEYRQDGLEVMLYYFTITTEWDAYLKIKEDINFQVMEIFEKEGVTFATPVHELVVNDLKEEL